MAREKPMIVKYGDRQVKIYAKADGAFLLQWKERTGWKNTTRHTKQDAKDEARRIAMRLSREPDAPAMISQEEHRMLGVLHELGGWQFVDDARTAAEILDGDTSLASAARFWREMAPSRALPAVTVSQAFDEFLASQEKAIKEVSIKAHRQASGRFAQVYGDVLLRDVTPGMIEEWMSSYGWGGRSWNAYRGRLLCFFRWCAEPRRGYLPPGDVAPKLVAKRKTAQSIPPVIAPVDFEYVLRNIDDRYVPYAAVCAFAGLRAGAEAAHLRWEHFDWDARHIYIDLSVAQKTQRERFVPIEPNLAEILLPFRKARGPIQEFSAGRADVIFTTHVRKRKLAEDWPSRLLRHTYISSRIARGDPVGLVAEHAGNSETISRKHYRRAMTKEAGEAWFKVTREGESKIVPLTGAKKGRLG